MSLPVISPMDFTGDCMVDETLPENTPIRNFYRDKTIFLTGGTGFLGQIFVEKLLRCRVKQIYLLTRPKRNEKSSERIRKTFVGALFCKLKSLDPNYLNKIHLIEGDTLKIELGISKEDEQEIIENVDIVLHCAADVRFDKTLQELCFTNVRGTREVLALAEKIKKLIAFAYVSTAFSHHYQKCIEEKFYSPPIDPDQMIRIAELFANCQIDDLAYVTDKLIEPWVNTYVFTKALAEELVRRAANKVPVVIIRPSIIIATHEEPISAWSNNVYGLNGMIVGIGLGFMRVCPFDVTTNCKFICADFVSNGTLAVIWNKAMENKGNEKLEKVDESQLIYQITGEDCVPYGLISEKMINLFYKYPSNNSLWLPRVTFCKTSFMYFILTIIYHVIPGFIFDIFFEMTNNEIRLLPIYRKSQEFMHRLTYFVATEFFFVDNNLRKIITKMSKHDLELFPCDIRQFNFIDYSYHYLMGLRTYISKEPIDNFQAARKRLVILVAAHYSVLVLYYSCIAFVIYFVIKITFISNYFSNFYNNHKASLVM